MSKSVINGWLREKYGLLALYMASYGVTNMYLYVTYIHSDVMMLCYVHDQNTDPSDPGMSMHYSCLFWVPISTIINDRWPIQAFPMVVRMLGSQYLYVTYIHSDVMMLCYVPDQNTYPSDLATSRHYLCLFWVPISTIINDRWPIQAFPMVVRMLGLQYLYSGRTCER